jgi:hypothetical protein
MSGFGNVPQGGGVPLGTAVKPGNTTPIVLQGSLFGQTDSQGNALTGVVTSDIIREMLLSGQKFRAHFQQTIGGAAQGFYGMALYNASNTSKSVLVTSVKGWISGNACLMYAFRDTSNPNLANAATIGNSHIVNDNFASATTNVATATYNSASGGISFPSTVNFATVSKPSNDTAEFGFVYMPSGTALSLEVVMFVANSAQYGIQFEWIEF